MVRFSCEAGFSPSFWNTNIRRGGSLIVCSPNDCSSLCSGVVVFGETDDLLTTIVAKLAWRWRLPEWIKNSFSSFTLLEAVLSMQRVSCMHVVSVNHPRIWSTIQYLKTKFLHVTGFSASLPGVLTCILWNGNCKNNGGNHLLNRITWINYLGAFWSLNWDSSLTQWFTWFNFHDT